MKRQALVSTIMNCWPAVKHEVADFSGSRRVMPLAGRPMAKKPLVAESPLMAENAKTPTIKKHAPTLYLIIVDKLFKGAVSLLLAFGFYRMAGVDLSVLFDRLVHWVHLDPENRFLTDLGNLIDQITPANMRWVATGTLLYRSSKGWG